MIDLGNADRFQPFVEGTAMVDDVIGPHFLDEGGGLWP